MMKAALTLLSKAQGEHLDTNRTENECDLGNV